MANTSDFKNGLILNHKNNLWKIIEFLHVKPGKGNAFVRSKLKNIKTGQVEFRADKQGNLHATVGKISFDADKLCENVSALIDTVKRMKPSSSKGIYLRNFSLSSTMGPGLRVDPQTT